MLQKKFPNLAQFKCALVPRPPRAGTDTPQHKAGFSLQVAYIFHIINGANYLQQMTFGSQVHSACKEGKKRISLW